MLLFLFEFEERKLYGVMEAASDGAMDILPDAFASLWKFRPAQVLFRRVWFCKPLTVAEFSGAIDGDCLKPHMSFLGISYQQVLNLVDLFSLRMIRLQTFQKPKSRVISDYKISLARADQAFSLQTNRNACTSARAGQAFSLQTNRNACTSRYPSMFPKNRASLPHIPYIYGKHATHENEFHKNRTSLPHIPYMYSKHATYENEPPLHPCPKPMVFKAPDIEEKLVEPDTDYIPLELDNPDDSERGADQSTLLGAVKVQSTSKRSIKFEDPITKPLNGKHSKHDCCHSYLLNERRIISEGESQKNVIDHIGKESKSTLQNNGCKRKFQLDERSDVLSPRRVCSGGNEVSVTSGGKIPSDKSSRLPASSENRGRGVEERDEKRFSHQSIQSKERDVPGKRGKLMNLSFAEQLRNQLAQSCSRNDESLVAQAGRVGKHTSRR